MSRAQDVKINEQVFGGRGVRERGVNKGVLIGTMGRFLSGNVSDSFRRVQYLFRLYSLPHRAGGMKKPLARDEGAVLAGGKQTSGDTHTHSPISKPCYCCCRSFSAAVAWQEKLPIFVCAC